MLLERHQRPGVQRDKVYRIRSTSTRKAKEARWSFEQAFYAVMRGFAIENEYFDQQNVKVNIRGLVTAEGVFLLAKLGLVSDLGREDIEERSKADIFAKLFVLSQITWFGLQVISRLASKYLSRH
jgi:hypothetical protein